MSIAPTVITNGSFPGAYMTPLGCAGGAVVAGGRDDHDAVEPELLDGLVERVEVEVRLGRGVQREVRDLDVVVVLVGEDPLRRGDHVGRARHAAVVHHPHRQDVRGRGSARIAAGTARRDPRHEGAVAVTVTLRVWRGRAEVHLRVGATAEILLARVEP